MIHESKEMLVWIRRAGRALPAAARRHARPWPHQLVLPRRRPRDAQRALRDGRKPRHRRSSMKPKSSTWTSTTACSCRPRCSMPGRCVKVTRRQSGCRGRRVRSQYRMAQGISGGRRRKISSFAARRTIAARSSKCWSKSGVEQIGDPTQCHAVAIDARAPKYDGGIITRLDCVVFGIVVNKHAQRFYDEGEDIWPKRYAIWGRLVAGQPDQIAYIVFDASSLKMFMPSLYPPITAPTHRRACRKADARSRPRWKRR